MCTQAKKLVRKQYFVSRENIEKIERLAHSRGASASGIVRQAIDAYDPCQSYNLETPELMALVSDTLKETIVMTKTTNRKMAKSLKYLDPAKA